MLNNVVTTFCSIPHKIVSNFKSYCKAVRGVGKQTAVSHEDEDKKSAPTYSLNLFTGTSIIILHTDTMISSL
jgi:hypothetical protein